MDAADTLYNEYKKNPKAFLKEQFRKAQERDIIEKNTTLKKAGFDIAKMTPEQMNLIFLPNDGPEVFYADGELSGEQAVRNWIQKLRQSGLNESEVRMAANLIFGKKTK
jgi:hypothetical protein